MAGLAAEEMAQPTSRSDPYIVSAARQERLPVRIVPRQPVRLVVMMPAIRALHVHTGIRSGPQRTAAIEPERKDQVRSETVLRSHLRDADKALSLLDA